MAGGRGGRGGGRGRVAMRVVVLGGVALGELGFVGCGVLEAK